MSPILYWYPVVSLNEDDPEDSVVTRKQGRIVPYQLNQEPYDIRVDTGGCSFHLIFGKQVNGMFLCMPEWNIGCEFSYLSDRDGNMDALLQTDHLDYEDAAAIVWALYSVNSLLKFIQ